MLHAVVVVSVQIAAVSLPPIPVPNVLKKETNSLFLSNVDTITRRRVLHFFYFTTSRKIVFHQPINLKLHVKVLVLI